MYKVRSLSGLTEADYSTHQAAYDLRKLCAKALTSKLGRSMMLGRDMGAMSGSSLV